MGLGRESTGSTKRVPKRPSFLIGSQASGRNSKSGDAPDLLKLLYQGIVETTGYPGGSSTEITEMSVVDLVSHVKKLLRPEVIPGNDFGVPTPAPTPTSPLTETGYLHVHSVPLERHFLSPSRKHKCSHCAKRFRRRQHLITHIGMVHEKELNCFCVFCAKGFFNAGSLRRHLLHHTGERPLQTRSRRTAVTPRARRTTPSKLKRHKCRQCGKHFRRLEHLRNHIGMVHNKENNMSCVMCSKGFYNSASLQRHVACHTQERPL